MKQITLHLSDDLAIQLETMAAAEGRSQADLIREALVDELRRHDSRPPWVRPSSRPGDAIEWAEQVDRVLVEGFGRRT